MEYLQAHPILMLLAILGQAIGMAFLMAAVILGPVFVHMEIQHRKRCVEYRRRSRESIDSLPLITKGGTGGTGEFDRNAGDVE